MPASSSFRALTLGTIIVATLSACAGLFGSAEQDRAIELLPRLVATSTAEEKQAATAELLGLGRDAHRVVIDCAKHEDEASLQAECLTLLARVRSPEDAILDALLEGLGSSESSVIRAAAYSAASFPDQPRTLVPALERLLSHPDPVVRSASVSALGFFGTAARPALPAILPLLRDEASTVRIQAVAAVARVGGTEAAGALNEALGELATSLRSTDPAVRVSAVHALGQLGPQAKSAVPALATMLRGKISEGEKIQIAMTLARIGTPQARRLAETVVRRSKNTQDPALQAAVQAVVSLLRAGTPAP